MFIGIFLYLYLFPHSSCNDNQRVKMMGIQTGNDLKIDKDTIFTQNMKSETQRNKKDTFNRDPDWSYSPIPKDVSQHAHEFKRNMSECLKEVQANDKRAVKRLSPKIESPVHGECLIACVLKRNGVIERGKIHKDNLIALVSKFYAKEDKLIKKLERNIDRCINMSIKNKDECTLASKLNECTNDIIMSNNKHKVTVT